MPLTVVVLPVLKSQTTTLSSVEAGWMPYATRFPSNASAAIGPEMCLILEALRAVVPVALATSASPGSNPAVRTRKARPSFFTASTSKSTRGM